MVRIESSLRFGVLTVVIAALWLSPLSITAQDLVAFSSLTGGSSVFVFRNAARAARPTVIQRPARSKVQRMESVSRLKRQYETLAKSDTRRAKAKVLDPKRLPS